MTLIYMVRHAEAEGNLYRRAHGQYDSSLTPKGLRQLDALAERFRDTAVDALYSSDLRRTMATAAAVARYHPGLELQPDPRLREVDLGTGTVSCELHLPQALFYEELSRQAGVEIADDEALLQMLQELAQTKKLYDKVQTCLLYTSPSPRDS